MSPAPGLTVIIPANNEQGFIEPCLDALIAQTLTDADFQREIIVAANGCTDDTVAASRAYADRAEAAGWGLKVLNIAEGSKVRALNQADALAQGRARIYLDADVVCDPDLVAALARALNRPEPIFASGAMRIARAKSWITRRYADIWLKTSFMSEGVQGAGLFAVNAAGRARWDAFPQVISDDTFVRISFRPEERISVSSGYVWPLPEGWRNLVNVRQRQDRGIEELHALYPALMANEGKSAMGAKWIMRMLMRHPISFVVYAALKLAVRFGKQGETWTRGR